jgi:hypothetical protein
MGTKLVENIAAVKGVQGGGRLPEEEEQVILQKNPVEWEIQAEG